MLSADLASAVWTVTTADASLSTVIPPLKPLILSAMSFGWSFFASWCRRSSAPRPDKRGVLCVVDLVDPLRQVARQLRRRLAAGLGRLDDDPLRQRRDDRVLADDGQVDRVLALAVLVDLDVALLGDLHPGGVFL